MPASLCLNTEKRHTAGTPLGLLSPRERLQDQHSFSTADFDNSSTEVPLWTVFLVNNIILPCVPIRMMWWPHQTATMACISLSSTLPHIITYCTHLTGIETLASFLLCTEMGFLWFFPFRGVTPCLIDSPLDHFWFIWNTSLCAKLWGGVVFYTQYHAFSPSDRLVGASCSGSCRPATSQLL